ncbi:B3 domain-containing transcription factor [Ranunculus cassubicifolius]
MDSNTVTPPSTTTTTSTNYATLRNQTSFLPLPSLYSSTSHHFFHPGRFTFSPLLPLHRFQQNESQLLPLVSPLTYITPQTYRVLPSVSPNPLIGCNLVGISSDNQLNVGFSRTHNSSVVLPTISLSQTQNPSSASKAARMRRKMAMKMKSSSSSRKFSSSSSSGRCSSSSTTRFDKRTSLPNTATEIAVNNNKIYDFSTPDGKKLKFIFEKELKNTDVGPLGRMVLPKKPSEEDLPVLSDRKGIQIAIREVESTTMWYMRFRFWLNNKSKIYILENTGNYVKHKALKTGDCVTLYKDEKNLLYISCKKVEASTSALINTEAEIGVKKSQRCETSSNIKRIRQSKLTDVTSKDSLDRQVLKSNEPSLDVMEGPDVKQHGDMYLVAAGRDYNMRDFENLSDFENCDFSVFDEY